jgi:hypothetical protein
MSVTVHEMENTISAFPDIGLGSDMGNTIDVTDVTDDLGMNLLANTKYMSGSSSPSSQNMNTISLSPNTNYGSSVKVNPVAQSLQEIEFSTMEPIQPISIDMSSSSLPSVTFQRDTTSSSGIKYESMQNSTGPSMTLNQPPSDVMSPPVDPEEEKKRKMELINKLQRLEQKGYPVARRFTMDNTLDEIKAEYSRLVDAKQLETSIRFQRNMLMGFCTGLEWMNNKFDPFDVKLDGWSESVHENVEDYDDIFEELYDKYKERGQMPPEARLVFQLAGSGFMCHISNSFFRAKMPSAENVLKSNPELAKQLAAAAAAQASPAFGNFMGMAMGTQSPPPQQAPLQMPPQVSQFDPSMGPTGAFYQGGKMGNMPNMPQNLQAQDPPQVARRVMNGPSGPNVDDILKTFEQVREAEQSPSPATMAFNELQSLHSEEMTSTGGSERTSGGRRKKRTAPVGNMISLNV